MPRLMWEQVRALTLDKLLKRSTKITRVQVEAIHIYRNARAEEAAEQRGEISSVVCQLLCEEIPPSIPIVWIDPIQTAEKGLSALFADILQTSGFSGH